MKRILYLDVLRGFLIFYVIFIHAILLIIFQANYDYIDILPTWVIAALFPLLLIAMWGPMFAWMSATTNTVLIQKQLEKKVDYNKVFLSRTINYVLIIGVHLINSIFFIHYIPLDGNIYRSLLGGTLETGQLTLPNILMFLNSGTLLLIGLSGILINVILFFFWKNKENRSLKRTSILFIFLTLLFLIIRPLIYPSIDGVILQLSQQNQILSAISLSWLFRGQFGLIPMAAMPFFGVIFGMMLVKKQSKKTILKFGTISTIGFIILAGLFLFIYGIPDLTLPYWPVTMISINLAIMVLITTLLILRYEFTSDNNRIKYAKRTLFFRRFNMITLTIFVFESIIAVLWAKVFLFFITDPFPFNITADILFLFCVLASWYAIVRIWERFDFKYSFEWFLININGKITGRRSKKLDVQKILYHPIASDEKSNEHR